MQAINLLKIIKEKNTVTLDNKVVFLARIVKRVGFEVVYPLSLTFGVDFIVKSGLLFMNITKRIMIANNNIADN